MGVADFVSTHNLIVHASDVLSSLQESTKATAEGRSGRAQNISLTDEHMCSIGKSGMNEWHELSKCLGTFNSADPASGVMPTRSMA